MHIWCVSNATVVPLQSHIESQRNRLNISVSYILPCNTSQFDMQNFDTVMQIINASKSRRCDVDKCSLQISQYTDPIMSTGPPIPKNTKTSSRLFRTGFHSSQSRLYFRSFARFLNKFSKNQRQTRLSFGLSGPEQMCIALLRKLYSCFWMPIKSCSH